jgi:adenosine deaminase
MHANFGFDAQALRGFMHNGLRAAWVDDSTRQRWAGEFEAGFDNALLAGAGAGG